MAHLGYSRDGRRGTLQVIYGLLCDRRGCPVAVELFEGSLHDDKTLPSQIEKLRERFKLGSVIVVSDRGMVTKANLELLRDAAGAAWITALKAPQVKKLVKDGALQLSLFDEQNLAELTCDAYPGERLVVCRNPLVAAERARKREDLVQATERALAEIAKRGELRNLSFNLEPVILRDHGLGMALQALGDDRAASNGIAMEVDAAAAETLSDRTQAALYAIVREALEGAIRRGPPTVFSVCVRPTEDEGGLEIEISDTSFAFRRRQEQIETEAALDGIYVLRTSVSAAELEAPDVVRAYKQLKEVERAFRTLKGPLELRPIHHRLEDRVRAHVFLCMLAYYLTWHLRRAWKPLLFDDEQPPRQPDPVAKARRSEQAERKARTKRSQAGQPCHSLQTLLSELATRTHNTIRLQRSAATFEQRTTPTETQTRALALINDYTPTT